MKKTTALGSLVTLLIFATCYFSSCKKPEKILNKKNLNAGHLADFEDMPTVSNGMLCFTDLDHFEDYVHFLDSVAVEPDTSDPADTLGGDVKLDDIEAGLGYTSLRKVLNIEWEILNENGWSSTDEIPIDFFIQGRGTRSVYNADKNVKVGDVINHLYDEDYGIAILDGDLDVLDRVNNLPDGLSGDDLLSEFTLDDNVNVYLLRFEYEEKTRTTGFKTSGDTTWKSSFVIHQDYSDACESRVYRYFLHSVALVAQGVDPFSMYAHSGDLDKLDVWVDWGDGTTPQTYYKVPITIQWNPAFQAMEIQWAITPKHTYSTHGTKTVTIKVKRPYHTTWMDGASNTLTIKQYVCDEWVKRSKDNYWAYSSNGDWAVRGCLQTHQSFIGGHFVFEATTQSFERKNNKYRHNKAKKIEAQLWFTTYSNGCTTPWNYSKAERPTNDKTTTAHQGWIIASNSSYAIIYSNHRVYYNSNNDFVNLDLNIVRCP